MTTIIPPKACSKCGYHVDSTTEAYGDGKPNPGDISICLGCGHATLFDKDLNRREPTQEEALRISLIPEVMKAQLFRSSMVGDRLKRRKIPVQ